MLAGRVSAEPQTQITSIFMIKEDNHHLEKGFKNINRRKLESKEVEMMIKVHPIDLSKFTSIGLELFVTEDTEKIVITVSATASVIFETSWTREV